MFVFLIQVIFALLIVGLLLWALNAIPWIDAGIKQVIKILVIVVIALWLLFILYGMFTGAAPANPLWFPRR